MNDRDTMKTYIIKTTKGEYYCGKSSDVWKRLQQHRREKIPHWFGLNNRRVFYVQFIISGDYEKEIKRFGVKKFVKCMQTPMMMVSLS